MDVKNIIEEIEETSKKIFNTASEVKHHSFLRKKITSDCKVSVADIIKINAGLTESYKKLVSNFRDNIGIIGQNISILVEGTDYFQKIIENVREMKDVFGDMQKEISTLNTIIDSIRRDTDDISSLALNASIVSSKYSHTSGVFDILSNKLNEMSSFISQNLESILKVVTPIVEDVDRLASTNDEIIEEVEYGFQSFKGFNDNMGILELSLGELVEIASGIANSILNHARMLFELNSRIDQMDIDSDAAITGSSNNAQSAEQLTALSVEARGLFRSAKGNNADVKLKKKMDEIHELSNFIAKNAGNVNSRSKTQLDFSRDCVDYSSTITREGVTFAGKTETLGIRAKSNNNIMDSINDELNSLQKNIASFADKMDEARLLMDRFNLNYNDIDNVIAFLKNIMKSMNLIGVLSKIESSREPEEYRQFMTISENITNLQIRIHDNIPHVEKNIERTRVLIETLNNRFLQILSDISLISQNGNDILLRITKMVNTSVSSQHLSISIAQETEAGGEVLIALRSFMKQLAKAVEKPIEGSEHNMSAGTTVGELCVQVIDSIG